MAAEPKNLVTKPLSRSARPLIRRIRPEDVNAVMDIARESETAAAWSAESVKEMLAWTGLVALTSERDGIFTGFLFARQVADEAELLNTAVRKSLRREGHGSALLAAALHELCRSGVRRVFLEVRESNRAAIAFYRKHGFADSGRRRGYYHHPIEDALCMEKKIPP
jgi:[ribosomal protein S18]-alanine N-acetyltransferase